MIYLILSIMYTSLFLVIVYFILTVIFVLILMGRDDFIYDKEYIAELEDKYLLGQFLLVLHPIALWWYNGPLFLWFRFVKGNKAVTLSKPLPSHHARRGE